MNQLWQNLQESLNKTMQQGTSQVEEYDLRSLHACGINTRLPIFNGATSEIQNSFQLSFPAFGPPQSTPEIREIPWADSQLLRKYISKTIRSLNHSP
jgi:hypothetical protein